MYTWMYSYIVKEVTVVSNNNNHWLITVIDADLHVLHDFL